MYYSAIGILAIFILLIENYDIFLKLGSFAKNSEWKVYRKFLLSVLVYYVTDALWGFIEYLKLPTLLYIDTLFYFVAMAGGLLFWTNFVVTYINSKNNLGRALVITGRVFFAIFLTGILVNAFVPILFEVDSNCVYVAKPLRHVMLVLQILMFALLTIHAFVHMRSNSGLLRFRYCTVGFFGLVVGVFLTIQLWFPYLPLYSIAYMLGTCLLHTFVINGERAEITTELENSLEREKKQYLELLSTRVLAYKDTLTGVKSKLAYAEFEAKKNSDIKNRRNLEFAVAVFDVNGLKQINDTYGHKRGDQFIMDACAVICAQFKRSPVFRIGGDEFVAILERDDFDNREELTESFNFTIEHPVDPDFPLVVALGITDYEDGKDQSFHDVFERADRLMYERKRELKSKMNCCASA